MNTISPYTGWTRTEWAALADRMLAAVRRHASPGHARIDLPGPQGAYGREVDGLEGFARSFLLAGFRLAGEDGRDPHNLAQWYAEGLASGTDPASPERWVRLQESPQARVEAASIALVLDLTRPWLWDRLDQPVRDRVVDYLAPAARDLWYPHCNWIWFRLVVQTFLRSVGGPHDLAVMAQDLAAHDSFVREDGWLADGDERAFDHYVGWAMHLYPTLWGRMAGAADLAADRAAADAARLDRYLQDAVRLIGANGAPLAQGRSLVYRFASAAPFWVGAIAAVPSISPGLLRRAASGVVRHFTEHGVPDSRGLLNLGWFGEWTALRQRYSGAASPYWAVKGMLGLALPATHPVWTAVEQPLPIQTRDQVFAVRSPGWVVSATRADGVVRVCNHGTDHALEGSWVADSPLYARYGYSTATFPLLDERSWTEPLDQSVTLLDAAGHGTHRSGMHVLIARVDDVGDCLVGVCGSVQQAHWVEPRPEQERHGSGFVGAARVAGSVTTVSLLHGPWEIRLVRVDELAPGDSAERLRIGGWSVAGDDLRVDTRALEAVVEADGVVSRIAMIGAALDVGVTTSPDASPLGRSAATPWLLFPAATNAWMTAVIELTRRDTRMQHDLTSCAAAITGGNATDSTAEVSVRWPDGLQTRHTLVGITSTNTTTPVGQPVGLV